MAHFFSWFKPATTARIYLDEEFPAHEKSVPGYPNDLQGLELKGQKAFKILKEFAVSEHPEMYLHIPGKSYEEFREYQMHELKKDTMRVLNISTDTTCEEFIRSHSPVRFSFRFHHYLFFFEADVLGKVKKDTSLYLLKKPYVIYQEGRSHQRYRLWPEYHVQFNEMLVADISQKGISFYSGYNLEKQNTIDNATLYLPAVYSISDEECYFEGGEIKIPQMVIANCIKEKRGYKYGGYFTIEWPSGTMKVLNDFILALRKKQREEVE